MGYLGLYIVLLIHVVHGYTIQVNIPTGSSYGVVNDEIYGSLTTNETVREDLLVGLTILGDKKLPEIRPNPVVLHIGSNHANYSIVGHSPGRFEVVCKILTMNSLNQTYILNQPQFVFFVLNNQWSSVFYQVGLNMVFLSIGLSYFVWRRHLKPRIPFWGIHTEGLFQQAPYRCDTSEQNDPLDAITLKDRAKLFWNLPCDDKALIERCGAESALCLRFLIDAGHLFAALFICSCVLLIPINYISGGAKTQSYQEATISNVPIGSHWFWGHVVMCYITTLAVFYFVYRQYQRLAQLYRNDTTLVGPRSVFIQAGLPVNFSSRKLLELFVDDYPEDVDFVSVVDDLSDIYHILGERMSLRNESIRLRHIYGSGNVSTCLSWCPGNSFLPSPTDVVLDYVSLLPCSRRKTKKQNPLPLDILSPSLHTALADEPYHELPPRIQRRLKAIDEALEAFPDEILRKFQQRKGTGAGFVAFQSIDAKNRFLERFLSTQSTSTKLRAQITASCFRLNEIFQKRRAPHHSPSTHELEQLQSSSTLQKYLSHMIILPAPEPNDIRWPNLISRPRSLKRTGLLTLYQLATMTILILFSTPASVLLYVNLDPSSPIYTQLLNENSFLTGFIHSYLPTLLLVAVNGLLLIVLFYLSIFEPWFTETKRMRSLLFKAFIYLFLSSILFPSIGVTAIYTTNNKINPFQGIKGNNYVNDFLFNICSNFFILYITQMICLGTLVQILRTAERVIYQPWMLSRAITSNEIKEAMRPAPFYFGIEYALIMSVFLITLLGTTLSPALVPCGGLYFYIHFLSTKYNFLYIHPKAPGRGQVNRSVLSLTLICLLIFQIAMALILSQIGRKEQYIALFILILFTFCILIWWHLTIPKSLEIEKNKNIIPLIEIISKSTWNIFTATSHQEIIELKTLPYQNPYDTNLKIFHVLNQNKIQKNKKLKNSFQKWKKNILLNPLS